MVFTLQRYIFREAFKVFVLAAVALTLILSLGSILRPVQEYGGGPQQVLYLMGCFLPITLTFVLPIAALFAGSLVYGRFASDNELDACRASGVSLLTLVYPGLILAIMVAIVNLLLSFYVMPVFVHKAEKSLKADAKQILFRNIQRRGYYGLPGDSPYLVYADQVNLQDETLSGVVIVEMEKDVIKKIITAERAKVNFNLHERFNEIQITAYNVYQMGSEEEGGFSAKWMPVTAPFPSLMSDDVRFKKIDEIKQIKVDPMKFYPVENAARQTCAQFIAELLAQDIAAKMADMPKPDAAQEPNSVTGEPMETSLGIPDDTNSFYKLYSGRKLVEFSTDGCSVKGEETVELSGRTVVVESDVDSKQPLRVLSTTRALLHIEGDELSPTLTMELYSAAWRRVDGSEGLTQRHVIRGLILPKAVTEKFDTENLLEAVNPASIASALKEGPTKRLVMLQTELERRIKKTLVRIKAEMHFRLVFGIGCVPMILIGIGLGIIKRGGHLLSAFGISAIPATVLVVCVMMGENIAKNLGSQVISGIALMWAGLGFLSLVAAVIYRRLLKN